MLHYTDSEIIERLHKNSDEAFEYMFLKFYDRLCTYAACLIINKDGAEEIVQDVFYESWEKREKLNVNTSLKTYLFKVQIISPISENYPIANLITLELDSLISETIFSLPDQCRKVFLLGRFEDLSY
jgi:RNA polymerase sigma-70 factor (ECF subfamily)